MAKYFKPSEWTCKCGCGFQSIHPLLLDILDLIREKIGQPLVISSGCRCPKHNKREGGKPNSAHLTGMAVDLECRSSRLRFLILKAIFKWTEIDRVGIDFDKRSGFIHLDIDQDKPGEVLFGY